MFFTLKRANCTVCDRLSACVFWGWMSYMCRMGAP